VITNIIILQEKLFDCLSFSDVLITILPTPFAFMLSFGTYSNKRNSSNTNRP